MNSSELLRIVVCVCVESVDGALVKILPLKATNHCHPLVRWDKQRSLDSGHNIERPYWRSCGNVNYGPSKAIIKL